ncbi:MAG: D-glycerate dehydrogenase [Chloroflexota bacterium]
MGYKVLTEAVLSDVLLGMLAEVDCEVNIWTGADTDPALLASAEGMLLYGHPIIDGPVMDSMPNLRMISNFGVGIDHVNLADAKARGIPVSNTPNLVDGATADMTFALMMAIARNIVPGFEYAKSPEFTEMDFNIYQGFDIHGSTLGIVGLGNIGKEVAKRASGFDMKVIYHNRNRNLEAEAELGVTYATLPELLQEADFVTLNVPMTPETHHLISYKELEMMKPTAYLINAARGGVMDHDAIVHALQNKVIAGVATDVTEPEPLPRDHPMLTLDNIIILPHLGSNALQTRTRMAQRSVDNLIAGLKGEPILNRLV